MYLDELFSNLAYGKLSNLAMTTTEPGVIAMTARHKVVHHINEALMRLHVRFNIREKDILIELQEGITYYSLTKEFSVNQYDPDSGNTPFILDLPNELFQDDVLKILAVIDPFGVKLPLNDDNARNGLFTPQPKMLQVPDPRQGQILNVLYQARHPKILYVVGGETFIDIPDSFIEALTSYVAYGIYSGMNTQDSNAKAQEHFMMYEAICSELEAKDSAGLSISQTNTRFERRGWI